ncbi:MAG: UDP-N-acetylglucosamine 2-epimerase (hydrolyzing) [Candidatus Brocadiaceae bacterium]|nr:UDP-N-acetylglucosamine 2-epimerase (hydrolyzing) [Candidatus Brocadiaceae bacterium]
MKLSKNGKDKALRYLYVATSNRSDYIKIKPVLEEMKRRGIPFNIVVSGSHMTLKQGYTYKTIEKDNFEIKEMLSCQIDGTSLESMSKSVGLSIMEHSHFFAREKLSSIMLVGDRFDIFPVAIAASMMNIPIIHIQGGEISGSIDESIRHAITKLSHVHFVSTEEAKKRVIAMGEKPDKVFNTGCPTVDMLNEIETNKLILDNLKRQNNAYIDLKEKDFFMTVFHPVTTEINLCQEAMETVLDALESFGKYIVLIYPNRDAGADNMVDVIMRRSRAYGKYILNRHLDFIDYINLMVNSSVFIGNSSSGIRETGTFGIPTVNIGTRQHMRDRNKNVLDVDIDRGLIINTINQAIGVGRYPCENIYGEGNASKQIVDVLLTLEELETQKTYHDSINSKEFSTLVK